MGDCICGGKLINEGGQLTCQSCGIKYKVESFENGHFLSFEIDDKAWAKADKELAEFCAKHKKDIMKAISDCKLQK